MRLSGKRRRGGTLILNISDSLDFRTAKKINNDLLSLLQAISSVELESDHVKNLKEKIEEELEKNLDNLENSLISYDS
jgi:hypothetical protein